VGVAGEEWNPVTLRRRSRIVPPFCVGAGDCADSALPIAGELRGERLELTGRLIRRPEGRIATGVSFWATGTACAEGGEDERGGDVRAGEEFEVVCPMGKGNEGVITGETPGETPGELGRDEESLCTGIRGGGGGRFWSMEGGIDIV